MTGPLSYTFSLFLLIATVASLPTALDYGDGITTQFNNTPRLVKRGDPVLVDVSFQGKVFKGYLMPGGRQKQTFMVPKWIGQDGNPKEAVIKPMAQNEYQYNNALGWILATDPATKKSAMIKVPGAMFWTISAFTTRRQKLDSLYALGEAGKAQRSAHQKECYQWLESERQLVLKRDIENSQKTKMRHRDKNMGNQLWNNEGTVVHLIDPEHTDNGQPTGKNVSVP
jgi:hypothetical protein